MITQTKRKGLWLSLCVIFVHCLCYSQEVPIVNYTINTNGQVELTVNSNTDSYYILKIRHSIDDSFDLATSMTMGHAGTTIISEPLGFYPEQHYQVLEFPIANPEDSDGDGLDDIYEFSNMPFRNPLNMAESIMSINGLVCIDSFERFEDLSVLHDHVQWSEFLDGKSFVKFIISDFFTEPKIYFINSTTHTLHSDFGTEIGIETLGDNIKKGQIIYHPTSLSANGTLGTFAFNYSNGHGQDFEIVQKTHELLAANMPFLENNLAHFITANNEDEYANDIELFDSSRIPVLLESDIYAEIDYWGLNQTEGFGLFRHIPLEEIPGPKDIVLYDALPNSLPRVAGIMTSVVQTPLSHVNLRAIQNNIPNAFVRNPLEIEEITNLLDHYIYYKVGQVSYTIREATLEEVNTWFDNVRPVTAQSPPLNLSYTSILTLDEISFEMYDGFGAKCANVATMRTFGFPEGTIPNGFGVPFFFYQEFMKHNGFFEKVAELIENPVFLSNRTIRNVLLKDFRDEIKNADMPIWMLDALSDMHDSFPEGTSIRCRSSTNNEDLPGFNGAGLYDSKTQHPMEGHISKSIKQVFASLWNLRAFDEREFYRISHYTTSMGVLCHPNYSDEKSNGVGVSADPLYSTQGTFYLNSQLGEDLITNPDNTSIPEEILLERNENSVDGYLIVQRSNLIPSDSTIIGGTHLDEMREYLNVIHDEFELIYNATGNATFAMDIEYKVTSDDQLIIKQARPWVSYSSNHNPNLVTAADYEMLIYPNPVADYISMQCNACNLTEIKISNILGSVIFEKSHNSDSPTVDVQLSSNLAPGVYILSGYSKTDNAYYSKKFVKR